MSTTDIASHKAGEGNLGAESKPWNNVYAKNLYGNVIGNADTATRATYDKAGNDIATTYATQNDLTAVDNRIENNATTRNIQQRLKQSEINLANVALQLEAENLIPDYSMMMAEDFIGNEMVDTFEVKITQCIEGSNVIKLENVDDIIVGDDYWISDGLTKQIVTIQSVAKEDTIYSAVISPKISAAYDLETVKMYRTTAIINNGNAESASTKRAVTVRSEMIWQGLVAEQDFKFDLNTKQANVAEFTIEGDYAFTVDGELTIAED